MYNRYTLARPQLQNKALKPLHYCVPVMLRESTKQLMNSERPSCFRSCKIRIRTKGQQAIKSSNPYFFIPIRQINYIYLFKKNFGKPQLMIGWIGIIPMLLYYDIVPIFWLLWGNLTWVAQSTHMANVAGSHCC